MGPDDLRTRRERAGVSLRDLEAATGINRGRLSIIERGVQPTPDELDRIDYAIEGARSCSHCHRPEAAAALELLVIVGVPTIARLLCADCRGRLSALGLEIVEDRRRAERAVQNERRRSA